MKTKHFIAFALALSVTFGMGYKALATGNSAQIETVICDNEDYRIVEKVINDVLYSAEYNKQTQVLTLSSYKNGEKVDEYTFDGGNRINAIYSTIVPVQSETGFGYIIGEPESSYACSPELYEEKNYYARGIRVDNSVLPDKQVEFRDTVDNMIISEARLHALLTNSHFNVILSALAMPSKPLEAIMLACSALDISDDAKSEVKALTQNTDKCEELFDYLYPYNLIH